MKRNRIRELRQVAGLTCAALAKKAGLPYATVNKGEIGYSEPCPASMQKIAAALGVKPGELWEVPHVKR